VIEPPGALRLRYLSGPQRGTTVALRPPRSRIGRSRDNDIILADHKGAASSGHHAEAVRTRGQWFVTDLDSSNGTLLNGARITRAPIGPGDRLQFGDVECEVLAGRFAKAALVAGSILGVLVLIVAYAVNVRRAPDFERVAATVARSVYLVAIDSGGHRQIVGTAFVVGARLLATNAHVADALNLEAPQPGRRTVIIRGDSQAVHDITGVHLSSAWRQGSIADDVAILKVADLAADALPLRLADAATLKALTRGTALATFGFPAVSTDAQRPRGRLSLDVLGDVRDDRYLAVGLRIAPGMSGSPIFLHNGVVIGLVAGGDFTVLPNGDKRPSGTNANWGISVTALQQLLSQLTAESRRLKSRQPTAES
jgi:V8-like Glu-specific endopeptidase